MIRADAVFVIRHPRASAAHRAQVAKWLREQADKLEADGANYAKGYTARYNPDD